MTDDHWRSLMLTAQAGDAEAYRRLLLETSGWLRQYYARRLPASMIEDAAQEVLLALHTKRHTYDPTQPFGPWLAAIARYKWIDRLRALKHDMTEELPQDIPIQGHAEAVHSASVLERLLGQIKPAQANAIRLVKLEGLSIKEAAARLDQTVALVKVNIHRGLRQLSELARAESHEA